MSASLAKPVLYAVPQHISPLDPREVLIFAELRRVHLRFPGMVKKNIQKLLKAETLSYDQVLAVKMEWIRLGLHEPPAHVVPAPGGGSSAVPVRPLPVSL